MKAEKEQLEGRRSLTPSVKQLEHKIKELQKQIDRRITDFRVLQGVLTDRDNEIKRLNGLLDCHEKYGKEREKQLAEKDKEIELWKLNIEAHKKRIQELENEIARLEHLIG